MADPTSKKSMRAKRKSALLSQTHQRSESLSLAHPDADIFGYVLYPDIIIMEEMTKILESEIAYNKALNECNSSKFSH
jgi:flagellar basal body rod protein FlgC